MKKAGAHARFSSEISSVGMGSVHTLGVVGFACTCCRSTFFMSMTHGLCPAEDIFMPQAVRTCCNIQNNNQNQGDDDHTDHGRNDFGVPSCDISLSIKLLRHVYLSKDKDLGSLHKPKERDRQDQSVKDESQTFRWFHQSSSYIHVALLCHCAQEIFGDARIFAAFSTVFKQGSRLAHKLL
jgi:hypothetical protein